MRETEKDAVSRDGRVKDTMDYSLHTVYVISILNFILPHESAEALDGGLISRYSIRNEKNGELMTVLTATFN